MEREAATAGNKYPRQTGRGDQLFHAFALVLAAAVLWSTRSLDHWRIVPLLLLTIFTLVGVLSDVAAGAHKLRVAGVLIGLIEAIVLLGPGPAAILGAATQVVAWSKTRAPRHYVVGNIATFTWFPLVAGLQFETTVRIVHLGSDSVGYYLVVFVTYVVALVANIVGTFGYRRYLFGTPILQSVREFVLPLMSAQLASGLLTLGAVAVALSAGSVGIALTGLVLLVFQYLIGELLKSKQRGDELHRVATTDELTGLANRARFRVYLDDKIDSARETDETFAVMLLDLDRFKEVNDTLGHHYGDEMLRDLGGRLAEVIGSDGLVARLGGDEFAILPAEATGDTEALAAIAQRVIRCVQEPVRVEEMTLEVGGSIGVARFPRDGDDPHSLLRSADVAMYAAKEAHAQYKIYAATLDRHSVRRLNVLSEFRNALDAGEIQVFYQPIMRMDGTRVHGAEGLVRWQHPELGLLPPSDFIPIVEQTELIGPLTSYVLERAVVNCARWRRAGHDLTVSVNLSVRNLLDPDLASRIGKLLTRHRLVPEALQLEITESMLMSDPDRSLITLTALSQLGVGLSVDDYGTGYSSLANLRRLPIDELKLDRSFVSPMVSDENDLIIVRSTINLGHDLGLKVVAEGVEDEATLARLAALGCDLAQGYHFAKPLPAPDFEAFIGFGVEAEAAAA
jgi:diguanylate cyclase (GGDEF)-like protein